ncbi:MAG TPA: cyclic 2,3-diphosphoglycerate synthase [Phycisphaerae bacterium]|nr:cyclic 2,3-diphosphoglycerate synthase [Phycisphaerae bacterium]HRT41739.1 cyclic 2,3-diphosphoglycerate synthase [Phycisphaerae bacterium]
MNSAKRKLIILGAAGRDFHDFNTYWRDNPDVEVVAFTATQIPDIHGRTYPAVLAGPKYPKGIPIYAEEELPELIRRHGVDLCTIAYSDLPHEVVMHKAALVNAAGADFIILGHKHTMLKSRLPVIAVCAVRTGAGKSQTSRAVVRVLKKLGKKVAAVRHPMPYGDLTKQICQRYATYEDLDRYECTIEEREEYEPHIDAGNIIYAGVDYARILAEAEKEAEVILWDGGNNDMSFYKPDLYITVLDPHRPGHERRYYPGETNLYMADVIVLNKLNTARPEDIDTVLKSIQEVNPRATVVRANSPVTVDDPAAIRGKRVLVVEDGPTLTHGEMKYGAAHVAARQNGAAAVVDPRPHAVGSIKGTFEKYRHLTDILPAMGYGRKQIQELEQTINAVDCDVVLIGTPIDLRRVLKINKPTVRVSYELEEIEPGQLEAAIRKVIR